MLIYEAFHNTLKRYDISGKAIARVAGVSESLVSQFRHGKKGVTDDMLDNLLQAIQKIAPGSRKHFCSLVAGELVEGAGLENAIKEISAEEVPAFLMALAQGWKSVDHPPIIIKSA